MSYEIPALKGRNLERVVAGKGEAGEPGLPLPVVAMGSIPHIYRREGLSPGDPNQSCLTTRNHAARFPTSIPIRTKFLQGQ